MHVVKRLGIFLSKTIEGQRGHLSCLFSLSLLMCFIIPQLLVLTGESNVFAHIMGIFNCALEGELFIRKKRSIEERKGMEDTEHGDVGRT